MAIPLAVAGIAKIDGAQIIDAPMEDVYAERRYSDNPDLVTAWKVAALRGEVHYRRLHENETAEPDYWMVYVFSLAEVADSTGGWAPLIRELAETHPVAVVRLFDDDNREIIGCASALVADRVYDALVKPRLEIPVTGAVAALLAALKAQNVRHTIEQWHAGVAVRIPTVDGAHYSAIPEDPAKVETPGREWIVFHNPADSDDVTSLRDDEDDTLLTLEEVVAAVIDGGAVRTA